MMGRTVKTLSIKFKPHNLKLLTPNQSLITCIEMIDSRITYNNNIIYYIIKRLKLGSGQTYDRLSD
jgi:hypothetical protein